VITRALVSIERHSCPFQLDLEIALDNRKYEK
jgi:hypothetical protein